MIGRHRAGNSGREHVGCAHRQTVHIGDANCASGNQFCARALSKTQVRFADFLADGNDDTFPTNHCSEPDRACDRNFDPIRNEFGHVIEAGAIFHGRIAECWVTYGIVLD